MTITNYPLTTPFSYANLGECNVTDHYVFRDPISGSNIFYPVTAWGGEFITASYSAFLSGGTFNIFADNCSQDFCRYTINLVPFSLYCITTVNYVLSNIDESQSKISKVIFNFGTQPANDTAVVAKDLLTLQSPSNLIVTKTYYPSDAYITEYITTIHVIYDSGCINTYILPISCYKCGIFEMYKDVNLINSQQTKRSYDVVLTLENQADQQMFNSLLLTNEPFYAIPKTRPFRLIEPVPVDLNVPTIPVVVPPAPVDPNPVVPPPIQFFYTAGPGIVIGPSQIAALNYDEQFNTPNNSIVLDGDTLPLQETSSIIIT